MARRSTSLNGRSAAAPASAAFSTAVEGAHAAPAVSVITAAYNAAPHLPRAIRSVQAQTLADWEMIVVDDASTDGTAPVAAEFARHDPRVRLVRQPRNLRQSAARNAGIAAARGRWIAVLDADDAFTADRLERLVAFAEARGLDMAADGQLLFDAAAGRVSRSVLDRGGRALPWTLLIFLRRERVGAFFKWGLLKPLISASFLKTTGLSYRESVFMGEDALLYSEILACGARAEILARPMYVYTTSTGELSGRASAASTSRYQLHDHLAAMETFREAHDQRLRAAERRALEGAVAAAVAADRAQAFKLALGGRRFADAGRLYLEEPRIARVLAGALLKRMRRRWPMLATQQPGNDLSEA